MVMHISSYRMVINHQKESAFASFKDAYLSKVVYPFLYHHNTQKQSLLFIGKKTKKLKHILLSFIQNDISKFDNLSRICDRDFDCLSSKQSECAC